MIQKFPGRVLTRDVGPWAFPAIGVLFTCLLLLASGTRADRSPATTSRADTAAPSLTDFFALTDPDPDVFAVAADHIFRHWLPSSMPMVLEVARFSGRVRPLLRRLEDVTGQSFKGELDLALRFMWSRDIPVAPRYVDFKRRLYEQIDPRFAAFFDADASNASIRLDEIRWGGVRRDGIPPLDHPKMISASAASNLDGDDIVFGIEIAGDARAYPKRILAWHEMFKDIVGGVSVNGVYCTLCGSMILYETDSGAVRFELGTSGFLYRSNKLMYDKQTHSLWSTFEGEPVVGSLVGRGIRLRPHPVVTTTWKAWRLRHPRTRVLSLDTGYLRDYSEGAAYHDYFASDELMFAVPKIDSRLPNKAEVLVLRFGEGGTRPLAIEASWLAEHNVYRGRLGKTAYVILTDHSGASRIYQAGEAEVVSYDGDAIAKDDRGRSWKVTEAALVGPKGSSQRRLAAHRAFWFGWHAAHPDTELIQRPRS